MALQAEQAPQQLQRAVVLLPEQREQTSAE
jgi:hypothetical protein